MWFEHNCIEIKGKKENCLIYYIQMDLCDITLGDLFKEFDSDCIFKVNNQLTKIGYYIASQIFIEILNGVRYLNILNIIHRDLKPDNILLQKESESGFVKIADFGLATIHDFNDKSHERDRGDRKFMAPEVRKIFGKVCNQYTTKVDVYSLGVIMKILFNIYIDRYGQIF